MLQLLITFLIITLLLLVFWFWSKKSRERTIDTMESMENATTTTTNLPIVNNNDATKTTGISSVDGDVVNIQYIDDTTTEKLITDATQRLDNRMSSCIKTFVEEATQYSDLDLLSDSLGKRFPEEVRQFQKVYDEFIDSIKTRVCMCFIENIDKSRKDRKNLICLAEKFKTWDEFRDIIGFPCHMFQDLSFWDRLRPQPTLITSQNLANKAKQACNCVVNLLMTQYPTPKDFMAELEWVINQSINQPIANKLYKLIDSAIEKCLRNQPICDDDTIQTIVNYIKHNRNSLWPGASNEQIEIQVKSAENLIKLVCKSRTNRANRANRTDRKEYNRVLTHFTRDQSKVMTEKVRKFNKDPIFDPIDDQITDQQAPLIIKPPHQQMESFAPIHSTNQSILAGDIGLRTEGATVGTGEISLYPF